MGFNPVGVDGANDLQKQSDIAFLLLDGLKRQRPSGGDVALCAVGLTPEGDPRPLRMHIVPAEEERNWRILLSDLRTDGIGPDLQLISADGHPALMKAIQATFPEVPVQICVAHRLLSLARRVDARWRSRVLAEARKIFAAPDRVAAVGLFREWHARWLKHGERAVRTLEGDLASCLTFHRFPPHLWNRIRTVNLVERAFREARRTARAAAPVGLAEAPEALAAEPEGPSVSDADAVLSGDETAGAEDQAEDTVLVVPAASNGHVTPDLIGNLTMTEDAAHPQAAETAPEHPAPADQLPTEPPPVIEVASQQEGSALSLESTPELAEAPSAPDPVLAEDPGWPNLPRPDDDTAVWGPLELSSDEGFDRRLAAYHRYSIQVRVAVTLTSVAGLLTGVFLSFLD